MKEEAKFFFRHLLDTNGPVTDFIDSDYTFVDKKLAKLYGLPEKETMRLADGFQRVSLADRGRRGGVLGMAGVLTASANGVETSPVTGASGYSRICLDRHLHHHRMSCLRSKRM